jgi:hypothetical protein
LQLNPYGHNPCVTSSLTRGWVFQLTNSTQSHITTDGQSASQPWCQAPSGAQGQIFVTVRHLRVCRCGSLFLTRGRVCHLSRSQSPVQKKPPWLWSASELCRPSDRRFLAK